MDDPLLSELHGIQAAMSTMKKQLMKLDLLEKLSSDVEELKRSVEFNNSLIEVLKKDNASLRSDVIMLKRVTDELQEDNHRMANDLLDLQNRSMRDNIIIHGLPEANEEARGKRSLPEVGADCAVFLGESLKMTKPEVDAIQFCRVHRLGYSKPGVTKSRPIVAKVTISSMKHAIMERGKELKGCDASITDQYPPEIMRRRRLLQPIMKEARNNGRKTRLYSDKLFIEGQLYRNAKITYWLTGGDDKIQAGGSGSSR
ncbi:hypothetical protein AAFF_G00355880 [Aldrovandia affinis]|uniref:Uncharacterized protein n=1 Tax=Aldrovandia affinis TaxID=143900 RepID=A0AAD7R532_9TELE|nr:hypothetical protein AAFF_G00355880 [Aldrovandia affinis]